MLIRNGRIPKAYKLARDYVMPDGTQKPIDLRKARGDKQQYTGTGLKKVKNKK